jgi:cell division transport system permease protein
VEEARFDRAWVRRLEALLQLARIGGLGLAVVVFAAVVFVMASVLRLAVIARRNEIDIMLLVGATPAFVRGPFLVAGLGQGLVASGLALLLVEGARRAAHASADAGSRVLLEIVAASPLPPGACGLLVATGLAVSITGAWFAVRRTF